MTTAIGIPVTPEHLAKQRIKILLVDDSAENLMSLEAALEELGQELVLARSGTEALRYLLTDDFAAILLDVKMPDMDGFQTAEMIRSRRRSRHTPILFLTAYKSDEHLLRGYEMGAVDFLFKPIVPAVLRSKVGVFVELSRNAALLASQADVLRRAEQKFRSMLEAAPDAMIIGSEAGAISLVNSQAEIMFGFHRAELIGQDVRMLVPGWSAPGLSHRELLGRRKDGTEFPVEITLSPLQTEEGLLFNSAIRDMTERRRRDDQVRELNAKLELRVEERTRELTRSNNALRQTNDDLNQFAYAASHDLQEPLRMVALYSEMLQKRYSGHLDDDAEKFVSFIINGARRMEHLLKDLLAYSQAGSSEGPAAPLDVNGVIIKVMLNLQAAIEENQATVEWKDLPVVEAHEVRLVQLFQNLIGNAIKYRGADPPKIRIWAERREHDWMFSVQDNGIGIRPEYAQQVFGIFKRLHGHRYPGTGIGLAICQRIVERYGGRIWVESAPGRGSRFCFTLPAQLPQLHELVERRRLPEIPRGPQPRRLRLVRRSIRRRDHDHRNARASRTVPNTLKNLITADLRKIQIEQNHIRTHSRLIAVQMIEVVDGFFAVIEDLKPAIEARLFHGLANEKHVRLGVLDQ
jgi:signal transduction histidine kinase